MVTLIIALAALVIASFGLYEIIKFEEDSRVYDCDNLDVYDDLEERINTLEYSVKSNNKNTEILASRISELETEIIQLKNRVINLDKVAGNAETAANNLIPFVDTTRGMAEDNKRRLDNIQGTSRVDE